MNIQEYIEQQGIMPGGRFKISAELLKMEPDAFHRLVSDLVESSCRGECFAIVGTPHRESTSGNRLYDRVELSRDAE